MSTPPKRQRAVAWKRLSVLTLLVLLAHGGLLMGAPVLLEAPSDVPALPTAPIFITRTIDITPPVVPDTPAPTKTQTLSAPPTKPTLAIPVLVEPMTKAALAEMMRKTHAPDTHTVLDSEEPAPDQPEPAIQLAATTSTTAPSPAADARTTQPYTLPAPATLSYDVKCEIKGFPCSMQGELLWQHDGKTYDARLGFKHFLLGSRAQTSTGLITPQGLAPIRFGDKVRSEVAAHFDYKKNKVSYSANTPDEELAAGAQDQLSVFMQLAAMLASNPQRYPLKTQITFQAVGPRSSSTWVFVVEASEKLVLPGGPLHTLKLSRAATNEHDSNAELWLAPDLGYLPARIRLTQPNGDFVDQRWSSTQKP